MYTKFNNTICNKILDYRIGNQKHWKKKNWPNIFYIKNFVRNVCVLIYIRSTYSVSSGCDTSYFAWRSFGNGIKIKVIPVFEDWIHHYGSDSNKIDFFTNRIL